MFPKFDQHPAVLGYGMIETFEHCVRGRLDALEQNSIWVNGKDSALIVIIVNLGRGHKLRHEFIAKREHSRGVEVALVSNEQPHQQIRFGTIHNK